MTCKNYQKKLCLAQDKWLLTHLKSYPGCQKESKLIEVLNGLLKMGDSHEDRMR